MLRIAYFSSLATLACGPIHLAAQTSWTQMALAAVAALSVICIAGGLLRRP
jgi:hypothetical protein